VQGPLMQLVAVGRRHLQHPQGRRLALVHLLQLHPQLRLDLQARGRAPQFAGMRSTCTPSSLLNSCYPPDPSCRPAAAQLPPSWCAA
jgi:hypothetical protein